RASCMPGKALLRWSSDGCPGLVLRCVHGPENARSARAASPPRFENRPVRKGSIVSIADISEERLGGSRTPERTPPHDLLAEQSALGGMLLSKDAVADVIETLKGADFYVPKHELIFEAILSLYSHGEPTDVVAVTDELIKTGELGRAGG